MYNYNDEVNDDEKGRASKKGEGEEECIHYFWESQKERDY
jgi:hypothetical protein